MQCTASKIIQADEIWSEIDRAVLNKVLNMTKFSGFYVFVAYVFLSPLTACAAEQLSLDNSVCSARDLELIKAQRENQKFILDFIAPTLFPDANFAEIQNVPLFTVYEKLAKRANRTITESGFSKFVEALNEITNSYTESCLVSTRSHFENFTQIAKLFDRAYQQRKTVEVHSFYGKMIYLDDQVRNSHEFERLKKRQSNVDPGCEMNHSDCKCPEGGINNVRCPCEFFDCLDKNNQLEPIFIGFEYAECLAFVVDTTGSMKDEIDYTVQIIKSFIGNEEELGCFMFVPFNDRNSDPEKSVGPVTIAVDNYLQDLKDFVNALETAFESNSGGDCPEYSYHGIMKAINSLVDEIAISEYGSQIIVLTDAPPKGSVVSEDIISYAEALEVCIHFFLAEDTFNCFEDYPGSVEEYKRIASETGGTVVNSGFNFSSFVQAYKNTPCQFLKNGNGRRKRTTNENSNCHSFQVSKLSSILKLTVQTDSEVVTIYRPDKTVINITEPHFLEKNPMAGLWTICSDGSHLEISPEIEVSMDMTPLYFASQDEASILTCTPPPGCTMTKLAIFSSQSPSVSSSRVQILNKTGESSSESILTQCNSSWIGEILTPPVGNYTYLIDGEDTNNNNFVYFTRRKVSFQSGEKYYSFVASDNSYLTAEIDDRITLSFTLSSSNPFGSTTFQFALQELQGFTATVTPHQAVIANGESIEVTITLLVASYSIRPGSSYTVIATASNGCMTLSDSKSLTIITPPSTAPPPSLCNPSCENGGTCVVIRRRFREFVRCVCPTGFIGRSCETRRN